MTHLLAALPLLLLGACALTVTEPVSVAPRNGEQVLTGVATASTSGTASFVVANGTIQCRGTWNPLDPAPSVPISAQCSDGRSGAGTATRTGARTGFGVMRMSDGVVADFVYGVGMSLPTPATRAPATVADIPAKTPERAAPPTPSRTERASGYERDALAKLQECTDKAIIFLDDGISSVEGVAEAVLSKCRPEIIAICGAVERTANVNGNCDPGVVDQISQNARPKISARVLEIRAARRYRRSPQPASPGIVRPQDLGT